MFGLKSLLKKTFISFYKKDNKFYTQKQIVKRDKILSQEESELEEEEFIKFIKSAFIENTLTYISTIIDSFNQGIVDSCKHNRYRELGINIDNIKILCLKEYSIFIGLYELKEFQKENEKFNIDFVFSPYLIIDMNKKTTNNTLYLMIQDSFVVILIYQNNKPIYSNIYQFKLDEIEDSTKDSDNIDNDDIDSIDDIDDIDDIDSLDDIESLDDIDSLDDATLNEDEIEDIDEDITPENLENEILNTKSEIEILDFFKESIKDYYKNYSSDFLEEIYIFSEDISKKLINDIKDETFLEVKQEKIDILTTLNSLALKDVNNV